MNPTGFGITPGEPKKKVAYSGKEIKITVSAEEMQAQNPVIFADVPDMSMVRVGDTYYMSSTTMHMSPGVPIMESKDLVNWKLINYAYDTLGDNDALTSQ